MAVSKMQNMKFIIKKRITGEIMYEGEAESFIKFVEQNKADLYKADLSGADLSGANLSKADLSEADLSKADLSEANLYKANLSEANLSEADLYKARIKASQKEELLKVLKIEIID